MTATSESDKSAKTTTADCGGKTVLGGGYEVLSGKPTIESTRPSGGHDGWTVETASSNKAFQVTVYAICASIGTD